MILKTVIKEVLDSQTYQTTGLHTGVERNKMKTYTKTASHVSVIAGIRRCGKSTLMRQIMSQNANASRIFINFEDARLSAFRTDDFQKLIDIINEYYPEAECYFDEIQNIDEWERLIRTLHDAGKNIYITGSNASLLSAELGTKLTGRYLLTELFPFSYNEFLRMTNLNAGLVSFEKYLFTGGFPDYVKTNNPEILQQLFNDIVMRDIVVRYGIKDHRLLQELGVYLLTNIGKEFSYHNLSKTFGISSVNTVSNYISYFEKSFLFFQVPLMTWSLKRQLVNPKKIYAIDNGLIHNNSLSFSEDKGRLLENLVFMTLRNAGKQVFYFREKNECDFVYKDFNKVEGAVQVCYNLTTDNHKREINGLLEAMNTFKLNHAYILTMNEEDRFEFENKTIEVKPVWKWYSNFDI